MASIIAKRKRNKTYYYVAVSKRVDGKPRIVQQTYLGTAERIARQFQQHSAPVPVQATALDLGLPAALWQAARDSGAFDALQSVWPAPAKGPSAAHFLLLAAIHRICDPGPETRVADWYDRTVLRRLWGFPSTAFTSQAFRDRFDAFDVADPSDEFVEDDLLRAQDALLAAFRQRDLVSQRVLACDTANFHAWIATSNDRNSLARRGHSKQKRNDLRQVGLGYALDGRHGLSLGHHVYPGNGTASAELPAALQRVGHRLDRAAIPRDSVTLVLDKGSAALANTLELERSGLGWVAALPWNQVPPSLRALPAERFAPVGASEPGVRAVAERAVLHGAERLCVVRHSATFAAEQAGRVTRSLAKAAQSLRRLAREIAKPQARHGAASLHKRIQRWLAPNHVAQLLQYDLERCGDAWHLTFAIDSAAFQLLLAERFGRTALLTNRLDWSAAEVVAACSGQEHVERVFRGLQGGGWLGWSPMHHGTDSKIQVHAFYCMLGISLLHYTHRQAQAARPGLSLEELCQQLRTIQQFELLYAPADKRAKPRVATVASQMSLVQKALAEALQLDRCLTADEGTAPSGG